MHNLGGFKASRTPLKTTIMDNGFLGGNLLKVNCDISLVQLILIYLISAIMIELNGSKLFAHFFMCLFPYLLVLIIH